MINRENHSETHDSYKNWSVEEFEKFNGVLDNELVSYQQKAETTSSLT